MSRNVLPPVIVWVLATFCAQADEPSAGPSRDSWEAAARQLQQATVTVRIWGEGPKSAAADSARQPDVTVCSGLCVREGRVITAALVGSDTPIRLKLPGGKQSEPQVQVIDEYSGLALLKADTASLVPLVAAESMPAVGGELLSAAAWGLEQPLVARGIVGGVDRKYAGSNYPPLLQCDCLTMQTSMG